MPLPRVEVPPLVSADRLLNQFNQQQRLANTDVYKRIEVLESPQALVVPADEHTRFWWRCDETGERWNNNVLAQGTVPLTPRVAGCVVAQPCGLVYPYAMRVIEVLPNTNRGARGAFVTAGMPARGVTLSAWVRPGGTALNEGFLFGVGTIAGANVFTLKASFGGVVEATIRLSLAGTVTFTVPGDSYCMQHEWNHLAATFSTESELVVVVNGMATSIQYAAGNVIDWTTGVSFEFDVGYPGNPQLCGGCIQDVRLETTARSRVALANAWRRGKQLPVI